MLITIQDGYSTSSKDLSNFLQVLYKIKDDYVSLEVESLSGKKQWKQDCSNLELTKDQLKIKYNSLLCVKIKLVLIKKIFKDLLGKIQLGSAEELLPLLLSLDKDFTRKISEDLLKLDINDLSDQLSVSNRSWNDAQKYVIGTCNPYVKWVDYINNGCPDKEYYYKGSTTFNNIAIKAETSSLNKKYY